MNELEKKLKHYRLNHFEFNRIKELLKREPQGIEWALFSALWSEHCSYKSSKIHLRKFNYRNSNILDSEGENAGIVDLGFGEKIAFKMESHNHPSFIEPYQGAATGVGGILRDIFTMGARPIALADYLCFGEVKAERMKTLIDGVVRGISGYGNCVGVPTVTGQTEFSDKYNKNILVNAMAVGLLTNDDPIALSKARGVGNWVVYVGAKTGKDGVHGASMASESFDDKNENKKPNVQIGDPFFEKLLIESCLEILKEDLVVAMQDMGAAGLTSSSFEMASKGQVGFHIDLGEVPLRDQSMTPEEILLSESQERMLLVCKPEKYKRILEVFNKWGLDAKKIGEVISDRKVILKWHGEVLTDIDPDLLVENAPRYEREYSPWVYPSKVEKLEEQRTDLKEFLLNIFKDSFFGSKKAIYSQYDQRVGLRTAAGAESSIAILKLPSNRALGIAVGCRPRWMNVDAKIGAYDAVFYPALQMAAKGIKAMAITDCLNFGNPEKNQIMSEFVASVESIAEAAQAIDAPVISGNVSFYNETLNQNITSTPATGLVGLRDDMMDLPKDVFHAEGDLVYWLRLPMVSAFAETCLSDKFSGEFSVNAAKSFVSLNVELSHFYKSSKTVGKAGLAYCLVRKSLDQYSFVSHSEILNNLSSNDFIKESMYEVVVSIDPSDRESFEEAYHNFSCKNSELHWIGVTKNSDIQLSESCVLKKEEIQKLYWGHDETLLA